jgi:membrane fusion protein (multidrug efflux system)
VHPCFKGHRQIRLAEKSVSPFSHIGIINSLTKQMMKKTGIYTIYTFIIILAGCTATSKDNLEKNDIRMLPVTALVTRDTVLHHEYVTHIEAVRNVEIRARVQGFLDHIYVDEGQAVKKGQPLFSLNAEEYKADLAKAKANLTSAIAEAKASALEVDRVQMLVDKKVISKTELELAQAKLKAANARIDEARSAESNAAIKLSYTKIKSPFDGVIDRIPLKVGSLIDEGTLLTSVSDVRAVYGYFNVSESEYLEYVKTRQDDPEKNNVQVQLVLADGSLYEHAGKIETVEGEFDESTGSIAFRARFANPEKLLKHGATGTVLLSNRVKNALLVPQKAVMEIQDKNYVFVVDTANKVMMKPFQPKARFSYFYIADKSLQPGEKIVYEGIQSIREGMQIQPQFVHMDSLMVKLE